MGIPPFLSRQHLSRCILWIVNNPKYYVLAHDVLATSDWQYRDRRLTFSLIESDITFIPQYYNLLWLINTWATKRFYFGKRQSRLLALASSPSVTVNSFLKRFCVSSVTVIVLQFLKSKSHIHSNGFHAFNSWQVEQHVALFRYLHNLKKLFYWPTPRLTVRYNIF